MRAKTAMQTIILKMNSQRVKFLEDFRFQFIAKSMTQHWITTLILRTLVGEGVSGVPFMLITGVSLEIILLPMVQWVFTAAAQHFPTQQESLWALVLERSVTTGAMVTKLASKNVIHTIAIVTRSVTQPNVTSVRNPLTILVLS